MLVLASQSPRRRELLALGGWTFRLAPAGIDERALVGEDARSYVLRLAEAKARAAAQHAGPAAAVIGADTAVVDGDDVLGKPASPAQAFEILKRLRGRKHQVYSAVAVLDPASGIVHRDLCITQVPMRAYTDDEIKAYIETGDPMDKAGAYAIQHAGFGPVAHLAGCFANVMGLPLCHLTRTLRCIGIVPETDIAASCQRALDYDCPVFETILTAVPG